MQSPVNSLFCDFFFFQAEDGIRDVAVTGVQTCALPISLKIDPATLMTAAPGIFAAGDIAFGPRLIINAVADGKKAAEQIDKFLRGPEWQPKPQFVQISVLDHHQMAEEYDEYSRLAVPTIPLERRTGVSEVETGFTEEQARREASRCLQCWINTIFEGNEANGSECILSGGRVDACPANG